MNPRDYQKELLSKYEASNEEAKKRLIELALVRSDHLYGKLVGPYLTYETYWFGAEEIIIVSPSSLHWVPMPLVL